MTATPVRPWLIFFSSASLFVLSQFYRAAVAVITPQLIADVGLDAKGLSLLSAAFFYGFAFTQIPLVIYLDRIGSRKFMTVLNLVAVAGAALNLLLTAGIFLIIAEYAGTAMTGINFFTMIGPAVFLQGLGSLMQAVYPSAALGAPAFRSAFFLCSGCLLTVACLYLVTDDTRRLRRA
jgi:sugar phosphate permease